MNELIILLISCAVLGSGAGFLAGLLGIGGGLVIVPVLSTLLVYLTDLPSEQVVIIAVATSLASILFTSSSSAMAHHKNGNVPWAIAPWVMTGVALGALASGFAAAFLPEHFVRAVFAVFAGIIAIKMLLSSKQNNEQTGRTLPNKGLLTVFTAIIGALSAMIGIGGGTLTVPLLTFFSINIKKAIGCASACGIIIALFGCIGYISSGLQYYSFNQGFLGFIYLPALLGIVCTSWFTAPLGAKATQVLPVATIKQVFAGLLLIVAIRMLVG
ncbi:sulfite exporter TauE/SafE family protein [Salinibius halmophilus]|uniref:sulfite exporter TauE/SafE family protein n=1 Tax=Salinibius halmophilus TaxID=1853216 RepID=UPI000E6711C6|nr:sulfite exporter TauE/SafE family protein [Salinibius halmophilus]